MRILICQITRMGDVLQTTPLVRILRQKHPGAHIALLVRKMGKVIAERVPEADEVLIYEEDDMFRDVCSGDSERLLRAYETLDGYLDVIRKGAYDVAYNCSHSVVSAMLLRMAGVPKIIGADYSDDWRFVIRGPWANYFFTGVFTRQFNDLNLCDVSQRYELGRDERSGLVFDIHDEDHEAATALLRKHQIAGEPLICLQLGASDDNKRWSAGHFAQLAKAMAEKYGARIALVGVESEKRYGEQFERFAPGLATHLFGETSVGTLAALLARSKLLVTNDTGTMHIAAAAGCPIVLTSVGYVHFRETGPYAEGCVAIERKRRELKPSQWAAHETDESEQAKPQQVLSAVDYALSHRPGAAPDQWASAATWEDVHLYLSRFAPDGCLMWYPLVRRAPEELDLLRLAYRAMWLQHLDESASPDAEQRTFQDAMACYIVDPNALIPQLNELAEGFGGLENLAKDGIQDTTALIEALTQRAFARAQELTRGLMRLDERIRVYAELHRGTRPIVVLARFGRDNLEGADPLRLAQDTLQIYMDTANRAALMQEKLAKLTEIARKASPNTDGVQ